MTRKSVALAGTFAAFALTVGLTAEVRTASAAAKDVTISEIMKKGHGAKGLLGAIDAGAKKGDWKEIEDDAKLLKEFGEAIGTLKPKKGDADSWKTQAEKYKTNTAAVAAGVDKKDAKAVSDGIAAIKGSCKECHTPHK